MTETGTVQIGMAKEEAWRSYTVSNVPRDSPPGAVTLPDDIV